METRVTARRQQQQEKAMRAPPSMKLSSLSQRRTSVSRDEEPSYSLLPPADIMYAEVTPPPRTWYDSPLRREDRSYRDKWVMFGNEAEKMELGLLQLQRALRARVDRQALRTQAQQRASSLLQVMELRGQRAPVFSGPLRAHCVWAGMSVTLACSLEGWPHPHVTWLKDGEEVGSGPAQRWNVRISGSSGLHCLEIRRCGPEDAGVYRVEAHSALGDASTYTTLQVNGYGRALVGSSSDIREEQEVGFSSLFPPTWVKEGQELRLSASFSSPLPPSHSPPAWFRDGEELLPGGRVEVTSSGQEALLVVRSVRKEQEGVYTVRITGPGGVKEHHAYVYIQDGAAVVSGGPASPLGVWASDVNLDYVFLRWTPPSADGASPVLGYHVERCDVSLGQWERCNAALQKVCHSPVSGLRGGTSYRFRVCAVNQAGAGRWSQPTAPILTSDPLASSRIMVVRSDRGEVVVTQAQWEGEVREPLPPTQVTSCQVSDTFLVLSWREPNPRGPEPLTYHVERCAGAAGCWEPASVGVVVASPRYAVRDLQPGVQYRFRTRSVNTYGVSEPSDASELLALAPPPAVPGAPHSVLVFRDSDSSVDLRWTAPAGGAEVLGFYLYYSLLGSRQWHTINNKPLRSTRFTAHGLQTHQDYVFRIKSVGRAGTSAYSGESAPTRVLAATRVPSPPAPPSLLLCSGSSMVLGWRAPPHTGGAPVLGYYLDRRGSDQEPWGEVHPRATQRRVYEVRGLTSGSSYQFRVLAANQVGLGGPSEPSASFLCEAWTSPRPGCPYDLEPREVRSGSLLLRWDPPLYLGASPLIGYQLHSSQGDQSESWSVLNDQPITDTVYKACGLQTGGTYRFRVSAVNQAGVGEASLPTEPITALTPAGTSEVEVGVDQEGCVFLAYEVPPDTPPHRGRFLWRKNALEAVRTGRATLQDQGRRSVLTFRDASQEDLGQYCVELSDQPALSSSYQLTPAELERLTELSRQVRNPKVVLVAGWQVEVGTGGGVRLWLQTEPLGEEAELKLILNDREIASTPRRCWRVDRPGGLVEVLLESLEEEDRGSYTAQIRDGTRQNQFTLLLLDPRFHQLLVQSRANRRQAERKTGPYLVEPLSWEVTGGCQLVIRCQVTNHSADSSLRWFKDGEALTPTEYDPSSGVSSLCIPQVTREVGGSYRAQVADGRGEDSSTLDLLDQEFEGLLQQLSKQCALSAGPVQVQGTAEGLRLYCPLKVYQAHLKTTWTFREGSLDQDSRARPGSSGVSVWLDLRDPADADHGRFTLELFDGLEAHHRHLDLGGPEFAAALEEHKRMKEAALAEQKRARVTKGLPDAVAIMEGKSLCLTCFVAGDPPPEVSWLRNGRPLPPGGPYSVERRGDSSALTVAAVTAAHSGTYSVRVLNPHGGEEAELTLSVYRVGETPPAHAVRMD